MDVTTLLVGVSHSMPYLEEVVKFLVSERVRQKRVMVELSRTRVPSEPDGPEFFRILGERITREGGILIYGDNEEILERTYAKNLELYQKMTAQGISLMDWAELHSQNRYEVPHIERDPHFLKVAIEQNPNIIVLGRNHITFLLKRYYSSLPNRVIYIPKED